MHILKTEDPMSIALKYKNWGWGWRYVNIDQNAFVSWHSAQFHAIKYVLKKLKSHGLCTEVIYNPSFNSVQFSSSIMSSCLRPHGQQHTRHSCPSPTPRACSNSCPSSQWFHSTISSSVVPFLLLPSIFPSIRVFSNESVLPIRWSKYWSFSFSISLSSEYSGLVSFRIDWLELLAVQGTLKSLLQHHSSKASILQHSALFMVQLLHPYMTSGKTIALTRRTFVSKVMSLLFNMLSRLVIAFLPRGKRLLISWLQSASAMILECKKIIVSHCFRCFPVYLPCSDGSGWDNPNSSFPVDEKEKVAFLFAYWNSIRKCQGRNLFLQDSQPETEPSPSEI